MKRCACGHEYDPFTARRVGTLSCDGEVLLLSDCPACSSTGAIVLVPHPEDVRQRLISDEEPLYSHERDTREEDAA